MRPVRPLLLAAAAAIALGLAGQALAQPSPQEGLKALHDALHLTPTQDPAWRAFAAASGPDPEAEARERAAEQMLPSLTSPQRVDLSIAAMQADLRTMERRGAALKTFYATLTPAQQRIFDRETLPEPPPGEGR